MASAVVEVANIRIEKIADAWVARPFRVAVGRHWLKQSRRHIRWRLKNRRRVRRWLRIGVKDRVGHGDG